MTKNVITVMIVKIVMILRHFMTKKFLKKEINNNRTRNNFRVNDLNKAINNQHNLTENQNLIKLFNR